LLPVRCLRNFREPVEEATKTVSNMKQTFAILIWAYRGKQNENRATLYARITVNGRRAEISLSRKIQLDLWDEQTLTMKGKSPEALDVNEYLDMVRGELRQHYYQLKATGQEITAEVIKNRFLGLGEEQKTLLQVFKYHNDEMKGLIGKGIAEGTHKRYVVMLHKLERFLKVKYKRSDIPLIELKYKFITDFEYFLKATDSLEHNTCIRYIKILKKIVSLAVKNEWLLRNPFQGFKCVTEDVEREVLTEEEIQALQNKTFPSERLEEVRDVFIFCCYTGYAYAEVLSLTPNHIGIGLDGEKWIFTHRRKTDNRSNVMLLPVALDLIEKYRKHPACLVTGKLFPVRSNQKYNDYLKDIAALCGITKKMTSHIARHTFATTVTLSNDVPIETVSSMLGHKSIRTTQIYAKIVQKKVSTDMKKLRDNLAGRQMKAS
jgi:site-specific recombinase XerD